MFHRYRDSSRQPVNASGSRAGQAAMLGLGCDVTVQGHRVFSHHSVLYVVCLLGFKGSAVILLLRFHFSVYFCTFCDCFFTFQRSERDSELILYINKACLEQYEFLFTRSTHILLLLLAVFFFLFLFLVLFLLLLCFLVLFARFLHLFLIK